MTGDPKSNKTIGHSLSSSQTKQQLSSNSFDEEDYFSMNPHDEQSHKYNQINQFGNNLQIQANFEKNNPRNNLRFPLFPKFHSTISRGSVTSDTGTSSSSEVDLSDLFREEFSEFKEEEEDSPTSPPKKVRISVKVTAKQARRLKRIAKFHPESLRRIGLNMLRMNEEASIHISDSLMKFGKPEDVNIPKQVQLDEQIPENFEQPFSFQPREVQSSGATEITCREFLEKDPLIGSCYVRKPKAQQKPNHIDEIIDSVLKTVLEKGNQKTEVVPWFPMEHRPFSTRKKASKVKQFQPISLPIDQKTSINPKEQGPMILMNSLKPIIHQLPVGQVLHLTHHETQESIGRVFIQPKRKVIRKPPQKFLNPVMTVTLQEPSVFKKGVAEKKSTSEEDVQALIASIKAETNRKLDEQFVQRWAPKPQEFLSIQQSSHVKSSQDHIQQIPASGPPEPQM